MYARNAEVVRPSSLMVPPQERASVGVETTTAVPGAPTPVTSVTQSRMENFRKVKTSEEESPLPFLGLPPDVVEMKVKEGSKIRNLMGFAMGRMALGETRQIVFSGCGRAVTKTITCVEIMKRKLGGLHQVTKVQYKTLREVWENKDPRPEGQVEHLTVHKNVPSICILLSKDPLDPNQMGYQPPEELWTIQGRSHEDGPEEASTKGIKRRITVTQQEDQGSKRGPGGQAVPHREEQVIGNPGGFGDQGGLWTLTMPPS